MIKNFLKINGIQLLEKKNQKKIIGGFTRKKGCSAQYGDCIQDADNTLNNSLNDCVLGSSSCISSAAVTYGNSMSGCTSSYNNCLHNE